MVFDVIDFGCLINFISVDSQFYLYFQLPSINIFFISFLYFSMYSLTHKFHYFATTLFHTVTTCYQIKKKNSFAKHFLNKIKIKKQKPFQMSNVSIKPTAYLYLSPKKGSAQKCQ